MQQSIDDIIPAAKQGGTRIC